MRVPCACPCHVASGDPNSGCSLPECWPNHPQAQPKPRPKRGAARCVVETPQQWAARITATLPPLSDVECRGAARLLASIRADQVAARTRQVAS